jgi:ABC transporter DrrB family efflux protein
MTALADPVVVPRRAPTRTLVDIAALTRRNLLHNVRQPQLIVFSSIQPIMFVLLFTYVFGGAIAVPGVDNYIDFLLPGIFVQTAVFGSTQTNVGLAEDLSRGMIDRFRSLPMARSAVLAGRTLADGVRNIFVVLLMVAVGYLIGFRFHTGWVPALAAIALTVLFGFAFSWVSASIGLATKNPEAAQAAGFVPLFPLVFASSAFVPVETMPSWLRVFADNQPITVTVDALRALTLGGPTARPVLLALAWIVGILLVFVPLTVWQYRRT